MNNKKKIGYLIWITGNSGSGKTSIAKKIFKKIEKKLGTTVLINGDDLRNIFNLKNYDFSSRKKIALSYGRFSDFLTKQGINVIFATISMFHDIRIQNRKILKKKYIEVYINTPIPKIIKNKKKKLYLNKKKIVGLEIKAEYPNNPDIKIDNDFSVSLNEISKKITNKIFKLTSR